MRIFLLRFMLVVYLLTATEYHELLRIPVLVEHFLEHQSQEGQDLLAFLTQHYLDVNTNGQHPQDDHLPFKSCDPLLHATPAVTSHEESKLLLAHDVHIQTTLPAATDVTCLPTGVKMSVWRPPQA